MKEPRPLAIVLYACLGVTAGCGCTPQPLQQAWQWAQQDGMTLLRCSFVSPEQLCDRVTASLGNPSHEGARLLGWVEALDEAALEYRAVFRLDSREPIHKALVAVLASETLQLDIYYEEILRRSHVLCAIVDVDLVRRVVRSKGRTPPSAGD